MSERPLPADRLANPAAVLTRTNLRELGWERRAVDAIFRGCPTIQTPGDARPVIKVSDYLTFLESCTFRDDRVLA